MSATAKVRVTIEIDINSGWGDNCMVSQVYKQARDEAVGAVSDIIRYANTSGTRCKVVGKTEVDAIIWPERTKS